MLPQREREFSGVHCVSRTFHRLDFYEGSKKKWRDMRYESKAACIPSVEHPARGFVTWNEVTGAALRLPSSHMSRERCHDHIQEGPRSHLGGHECISRPSKCLSKEAGKRTRTWLSDLHT